MITLEQKIEALAEIEYHDMASDYFKSTLEEIKEIIRAEKEENINEAYYSFFDKEGKCLN